MSHISGIRLTFETAKRNIVMPISVDNEALWKYAKNSLAQKLDEVKGVEDWSTVQIMIEPIYDDNVDVEHDLDDNVGMEHDLDDNEEFVF